MIRMPKFLIHGGRALHGEVNISGSKNAVLPMMAATLLADGDYQIRNVPVLRDVKTMVKMLHELGMNASLNANELVIHTRPAVSCEASYDLVKTMRASIYVLGPLLARYGEARVSLPGGCAWGPRPVNLHIEGMRKLGVKIAIENGYIHATAKRLNGAHISLDMSSVGATGNILMAAVLARGVTEIENAAREPEITALAEFLNAMGAGIHGIGTDHLIVEGVESMHPCNISVIPDRIEAGTFLIGAHMTGGQVTLNHAEPAHLSVLIDKLIESGARIDTENHGVRIRSHGKIKPVDVKTGVYPGFPTDMQAQWMALMSIANGVSRIRDEIYLDRFTHVAELKRLGADIDLNHNAARIMGKKHLSGAPVMSTDLRASASLILAGLVAKGRTDVSRIYHIERGYEGIDTKLRALGADIQRDLEELVV